MRSAELIDAELDVYRNGLNFAESWSNAAEASEGGDGEPSHEEVIMDKIKRAGGESDIAGSGNAEEAAPLD